MTIQSLSDGRGGTFNNATYIDSQSQQTFGQTVLGNGVPATTATPFPVLDAAVSATAGTTTDAAWSGTGASTLVALLRSLYAKLAGTLTVGGSVGVNNFPAAQAVTGSIAVSSGTITLTNPTTAVSVSNFPTLQPVSGAITVTSGNIAVTGTVAATGTIAINNFPGTQAISGAITVTSGAVTSYNPATVTITTVTVTSTSTTLLAANATRKSLAWYVTGNNVCYLNYGSTAAVTGTGIAYGPAGLMVGRTFGPGTGCPTQAITGISANGTTIVFEEGN